AGSWPPRSLRGWPLAPASRPASPPACFPPERGLSASSCAPLALSPEPPLRGRPLSAPLSALASPALASAAFGPVALASAVLLLGLRSLTVSATAAANASFLSGLGDAVFSVPSVPGRPLNFCQSPVISSSRRTGSVG